MDPVRNNENISNGIEGEKRKILIVDDDNFLLDMYALKFSQNSFEVYTATNGLQAIEKIKGGLSPEVLLVEIIMSNKSEQKDIDKGNTLGVAGYIVKANSTPAEVIDQVINILSSKIVVPKK